MEMINGQSLVSVARQRDDSEHLAMALNMCDVGASIHGFDVSALPGHIEVPTSWDDYIESRIREWTGREGVWTPIPSCG